MKIRLKIVESTQKFMRDKIESGEAFQHLDAVVTELQTAGLGRQGRPWIAAPGNLFASIYVELPRFPLTWIPLWVATCLFRTLEGYGVEKGQIKIKWPNDLVHAGRSKLAGILCEKSGDGILVGVGVNLKTAPSLPDRPTISLEDVLGSELPPDVAVDVLDRLIREMRFDPMVPNIRRIYEANSLFKAGDPVEFEDLQTRESGRGQFLRFGDYGEMVVDIEGKEKKLLSEEVHLKPHLKPGS